MHTAARVCKHQDLSDISKATNLNGFHCVIFVQFVDVIGDAGVERRSRYGVDNSGVVRLLLVPLAVRVHQQSDQAAQYGAAESHRDHVEEVKIWKRKTLCFSDYDATIRRNDMHSVTLFNR